MGIVLIKVHAGGGWEGHVVYTATHPLRQDISEAFSSIEEVMSFCKKYGLEMDEIFIAKIKQLLIFNSSYGYVIAPEYIDESLPISSASQFLKTHLKEYYF